MSHSKVKTMSRVAQNTLWSIFCEGGFLHKFERKNGHMGMAVTSYCFLALYTGECAVF